MKINKYLYISFILAILVGCENTPQKVVETTPQTIQEAATPTGTVATIKYEPLITVDRNITQLNKDVMPILTSNCVTCHGIIPLKPTTTTVNRFSIDSNSSANTYVNITSNNFVDINNTPISILLKKATNSTPHYGGMKIQLNSAQYNTIFSWIKDGANNN